MSIAPRDGPLRIATRSSELALRQAREVQRLLEARGVASELKTYRTTGDKRLDEPLSAIGGKGLFTEELEHDLRRGKVDCCVHSLKDLPTESPEGLVVAAVLPREDPRDVVVLGPYTTASRLGDLPRGARVGTSSLRRRAQLLAAHPDLEVVELRGNVPTRLRKVDAAQVDAAVLAAAGLKRLDAPQHIGFYLDPPAWLPAAGQGAIAVQSRTGNEALLAVLRTLDDADTSVAVRAERAFLAALEGGCQVPIGALAIADLGGLVLHGLVADPRGRRVVRGERAVDPADPEHDGRALALELRSRGADAILEEVRRMAKVPSPQPE
jgi:hydroxymethylbilane synthase